MKALVVVSAVAAAAAVGFLGGLYFRPPLFLWHAGRRYARRLERMQHVCEPVEM